MKAKATVFTEKTSQEWESRGRVEDLLLPSRAN